MLQQFESYLKQQFSISEKDTVLLTVSGGIDSVVLCHLFAGTNIKFAIAHCNFSLRGKESDKDETFVEALAEKHQVAFHSIQFDTTSFAKKNKLSIQVAARELRYDWFEGIRKQYKYKYIATAHHLNDSIETFFINLSRGTGISGLHGILPIQNNIIRPLLYASKEDIIAYAQKHKIKYREDSSNASDKYTRNKIRHTVVPVFKDLNPNFENTIAYTLQHIKDVETIYKNDIESKRSKIVKTIKNNSSTYHISIDALKQLNPIATYLFEFLKPFNFNTTTVNNIIDALNAESGKQFFSETHRIIKDREFLIIELKSQKSKVKSQKTEVQRVNYLVTKKQKTLTIDSHTLTFDKLPKLSTFNLSTLNTIAQLDFDKLEFPLEIRKWQKGDEFYPLGMKGKKKLSDFFIDKKLSIQEKENTWLLVSNDKIVWVIGLRIDDRFKITEASKTIYSVNLC